MRKKVETSTNSKEEKEEFYKKINLMRSNIEKSYGMPIILNNHIKDKEGKFIVFCKNKKHLKEIKDTVIEWFKVAGFKNINSYVVHSSYEEKDKEYKAFCDDMSHNLKLLFTVNMLNEGLHLENISGVLLLRNTGSYIVLMQQIGRAIEANSNNTPIIIDAVNNFSYVKDGIKLLKEIKEAIKEEKKNNKNFDDSEFLDIDTFFITEYVCDVENLLNEIEGGKYCNWNLYIKALRQYKDRENHCCVPFNHIEIVNGVKVNLGNWCKYKRVEKNNMKEERIKELNEIGFIWSIYEYNFLENVSKVEMFYRKNGYYPSTTKEDINLNSFLNRERFKRRNDSDYPTWKIDIIDNKLPNFSWNPENEINNRYEQNWELLKECINNNIFINTKNKKYKGVNLFTWIMYTVRRRYSSNELSDIQVEILEKVTNKSLEELYISKINKPPIEVFDLKKNKVIGTYNTIMETSDKMKRKYNIKIARNSISNYLNGKQRKPYKGRFIFSYAENGVAQ